MTPSILYIQASLIYIAAYFAYLGSSKITLIKVIFIIYTTLVLISITVVSIKANGMPIWFGWFDLYNLIYK